MYDDTPNKNELDWFEEQMKSLFDYERLKDCDLEYLQGQHYLIENDKMIFESSFPHKESVAQGAMRAFVNDNPSDTKEALTSAERMRLRYIKKEAKLELHRAIGHRKEINREQRNKLANSIADGLTALSQIIPPW